MPKIIRNWDRSLSWRPRAVHHPRDAEEVSAVIRAAAAQGRRVKAVGSSLSWSDVADIPEEVMLLDRMAHIRPDPGARRVTVGSGARLADVNQALAAAGLSFENFGSIVMQTAGGYTGTGTHGTGGRTPILSSFIESMRLVDGRGTIHELSAQEEPELFSAARVHLGALGVVTELTIRCVETFDLEERLELMSFDHALADLDHLVDQNDYCKLWWLPTTDQVQVYTFNKTTEPRTRLGFQGFLDSSGLSGRLFGAILAITRVFPRSIPWFMRTVQRLSFQPHMRRDRSDKIIRYAGSIPRHQETEYAIPRARAAKAIEAMRDLVLQAKGYSVNFPQEIRFVAPDDIPMSPASGRPSCYLGGYLASRTWAPRYFADFEALMADHAGRPHWGKSFTRSPAELRALYPGYAAFAALRRTCDPQGVFRNAFTDRVFGLG